MDADAKDSDDRPVLLSGAARASRLATAGYLLVLVGHVLVLMRHMKTAAASAESWYFFGALAANEVALAFEGFVYAAGALGRRGNLWVLSAAGRVKLLGAAIAWPWLVPWFSELACRSGAVSVSAGSHLLNHTTLVAVFIGAFYMLRELSFLVRGEPLSALTGNGDEAQIGDCLPSQAVLGGQFRLDKADLEETGRAIFVPARARNGLHIGSGLAMLASLFVGVAMAVAQPQPPYILLGAICALLGRRWGELPKFQPRGTGEDEGGSRFSPWRREGPRLTTRLGELVWIACCVLELERSEADPGWLAACAVAS